MIPCKIEPDHEGRIPSRMSIFAVTSCRKQELVINSEMDDLKLWMNRRSYLEAAVMGEIPHNLDVAIPNLATKSPARGLRIG